MVYDLAKWMFVNLMVVLGLAFLSAHPPIISRFETNARFPWRDTFTYSLMSVSCMLFPWQVVPGVFFDLRGIPVALLGWLHGSTPALIAAAIAGAVRMSKGGDGVMPALLSLATMVIAGQLFRRRERTLWWLLALGATYFTTSYLYSHWFMPDLRLSLPLTSPLWLLVAVVFMLGPVLIHAAIDHVQEKHRLQLELDHQTRAKAAVLELIPYAVVLLDGHGRQVAWNQAARALREAGVLHPALAHDEVAAAIAQRRAAAEVRVGAESAGEGEEPVFLVSVHPLENQGALVGVQNVTTVVREERANATQERLQLLGRLAAMAAHEIKNPLTTIRGFLQLLSNKREFEQHSPTFALVQGEVEHINQVVGDFLVLSNTHPQVPTRFNLRDLLESLLDIMRLRYPSARVEVTVIGQTNLFAHADQKAVRQILQNLMANAYEAMIAGGRLEVTYLVKDDKVDIRVMDTGPGISEEMLPFIFQPYTTTKVTGTGLGLAISHKLAAEMGGELTLTSEAGRGTVFRLVLPKDPSTS